MFLWRQMTITFEGWVANSRTLEKVPNWCNNKGRKKNNCMSSCLRVSIWTLFITLVKDDPMRCWKYTLPLLCRKDSRLNGEGSWATNNWCPLSIIFLTTINLENNIWCYHWTVSCGHIILVAVNRTIMSLAVIHAFEERKYRTVLLMYHL